jgi:hypothetical protein
MCGEKGARGEGARGRHDAASPNQALQRGDATREGRKRDATEATHARGDAARAARQGEGEGSA